MERGERLSLPAPALRSVLCRRVEEVCPGLWATEGTQLGTSRAQRWGRQAVAHERGESRPQKLDEEVGACFGVENKKRPAPGRPAKEVNGQKKALRFVFFFCEMETSKFGPFAEPVTYARSTAVAIGVLFVIAALFLCPLSAVARGGPNTAAIIVRRRGCMVHVFPGGRSKRLDLSLEYSEHGKIP